MKIVTVIPVYKPEPDEIESFSLEQYNKICGTKYDIVFIAPENMSMEKYDRFFEEYEVKRFSKHYFVNTITYSQLLVQHEFWTTFKDYDYMMIYQPDCLIFRDEITEWAEKGYEYIGAPIFSSLSYWPMFIKNKNHKPIVGNGGFSLRKIQTFIDICDPTGEIRKTYDPKFEIWPKIWCEDRFYCDELREVYMLDIPTWETATKFALDMNVDYAFDMLNIPKIPMGCHAYDKNIRSWKELVDIPENVVKKCEEKYDALFKGIYNENNKTYIVKK